MISAAPYTPKNAPDLRKAFLDGFGIIGPASTNTNDNAAAQTDTLDLNPGRRDLLARLKTLIANGQPDKALDLIVKKSDAPEMKAIADKVHEVFKDYGYKDAAKEMAALMPEIDPAPKSVPAARLSALVM